MSNTPPRRLTGDTPPSRRRARYDPVQARRDAQQRRQIARWQHRADNTWDSPTDRDTDSGQPAADSTGDRDTDNSADSTTDSPPRTTPPPANRAPDLSRSKRSPRARAREER